MLFLLKKSSESAGSSVSVLCLLLKGCDSETNVSKNNGDERGSLGLYSVVEWKLRKKSILVDQVYS